MIDKAIVIFSGIQPRVINPIAKGLRSVGIEPVVVSFDGTLSNTYFENLAQQTLHIAKRETNKGDIRLTSVLVSAISGKNIDTEKVAFFPALRRIEIRPEWANNPDASFRIKNIVQEYFKSEIVHDLTKRISSYRDNRMLLPAKNTPCKSLNDNFNLIYNNETTVLNRIIEKHITIQRKKRTIKVSDLNFSPAKNNGKHPIRRCTNSFLCDLRSMFRFGANILDRFEFDVTGENSLKGKTFYLCDGTSQLINKKVSHLNMRINDDFMY